MAQIYKFSNLPKDQKHTQAAEVLKEALIRNAGVYIKLGQLMATLEILVPKEYIAVLRSMYQHAPKSSIEEITNTIETDLNCKLSEIFLEFDPKPLKSGSIAQVHKAKLKTTGETVAVKVQHQWLRESLPVDIKLTEFFVIAAEALFPEDFKFRWLLYDLKKDLPKELNFKNEAINSQNLEKCFKSDPKIKIPSIHNEYLSERVMVQEFMDNIVNIDQKDELIQNDYNLKEVSRLLSDCFCKQIFHYGIIHGDPHSGNIFVRKNSKDLTQLVILDHGIYKYLSDELRLNYSMLWNGLILQDEKLIKEASERMGAGKRYHLFAAMVSRRPWIHIMRKDNGDVKSRLGVGKGESQNKQAKDNALKWKNQIAGI